MIAAARSGALGTLDGETGAPYVSLVAVAADADGALLLLLSRLAQHSRNIGRDPRVSLLLGEPAGEGDPLAGTRLTLEGRLEPVLPGAVEAARACYSACHPGTEDYDRALDFSYWRLVVTGCRLVAGFGRIHEIRPQDLRA